MATRPCPEALYGHHGEANTSGRCPYCGDFLGRPGRARWSGSVDPDDWTDAELLDRDPDLSDDDAVWPDRPHRFGGPLRRF